MSKVSADDMQVRFYGSPPQSTCSTIRVINDPPPQESEAMQAAHVAQVMADVHYTEARANSEWWSGVGGPLFNVCWFTAVLVIVVLMYRYNVKALEHRCDWADDDNDAPAEEVQKRRKKK